MRVLLTGATGYIGSAVLDALVGAGHDVQALVRDVGKAEAIEAPGVTPVVGDLQDVDHLGALASVAEGVVHTASPGDETSARVDHGVVDAVVGALADSGKPFVYTAGLWDYGPGQEITEATSFSPPLLTSWRPEVTARVLDARGVRSVVVAPGLAFGRQERLLHLVTGAPCTDDGDPALVTIGAGSQHWSPVHVDDLADLYVRALEQGEAGSTFIGVDGTQPTVGDLAAVASRARGLEGRVATETPEETHERLGVLAEPLLMDQRASGARARQLLGWSPQQLDLTAHVAATTAVADN